MAGKKKKPEFIRKNQVKFYEEIFLSKKPGRILKNGALPNLHFRPVHDAEA